MNRVYAIGRSAAKFLQRQASKVAGVGVAILGGSAMAQTAPELPAALAPDAIATAMTTAATPWIIAGIAICGGLVLLAALVRGMFRRGAQATKA